MSLLLCLWSSLAFAQTQPAPGQDPGNRLEIIKTDLFHFATFGEDSLKIRKLIGNVHLRQDTTDMLCDSAYQFIDSNYVVAYSNVRILMGQTRQTTCKKLTYNGETKILNLFNNVVMRDSNVTLRTEKMTYYRIPDYGEYLTPGTLETDDNVLTSGKGYYYPGRDMAFFKDNVKLVNPDFILLTDTLGYNTETEVAFFLAPTVVDDSAKTNHMYTEDGYYDTKNDFAMLYQNSSVGDTSYTLFGDTIMYDERRDLGEAHGHVKVIEADSGLTIYGNFGEFQAKTNANFITDSAFAVQYFEDDTLYLFADTLASFQDSSDEKRYFMAFNNTTFFMRDFQGRCDSLAYWYDDSVMNFYQDPVLWSDESQITGDTIIMTVIDGELDSMAIPTTPFIAIQEDSVGFNQIKGKQLFAKFKDNALHKMWIYGNSESIYFTKDDKDKYMGMNQAVCTDMFIEFKENKPSRILFEDKPEGKFSPMHMIMLQENKLEGFKWRGDERPIRPEWVFPVLSPNSPRDTVQMRLDSVLNEITRIEDLLFGMFGDSIFEDPEPLEDVYEGIDPDSLEALMGNPTGIDSNGIGTDSSFTDSTDGVDSTATATGSGKDKSAAGTGKDKTGKGKTKKDRKGLKDWWKKMKAKKDLSPTERRQLKIQKRAQRIMLKGQRRAWRRGKELREKARKKRRRMKPKDKIFGPKEF